MLNLINTQFYEEPFHPELGCGVRDMLFENYAMTGIFMRKKNRRSLSNYGFKEQVCLLFK